MVEETHDRLAVATVLGNRLFYSINWFSIPPIFYLIALDLHEQVSGLGLISSAFLVGIGLFQVPGAILSSKFGARSICILGMVLLSGSALLCALVSSIDLIAVLRFFSGPELFLLAGAAAYAAAGRGRWATTFQDRGLCLSNAEGVLTGGRILHEVRSQFGPISVWILSSLCRTFGARLATVVWAQFAIGLAAVMGVQRLARRFLAPPEQWLCAGLLAFSILWMLGPGNLLYPYRFAVSHALLLGVAAMLVARPSGGLLLAGVAGALAGAAFATKQEIGAASAAGVSCLILLAPIATRARVRRIAAAAIGGAGAYCLAFGLCLRGEGFLTLARKNLLWPWVPVPESWRELYAREQGMDAPGRLLAGVADSSLIAVLYGGTAWLIIFGSSISRRRRWILGTGLAVAWAVWIWRWTEGAHFRPFAICLPVFCAAAVVGAVRFRRDATFRDAAPSFAALLGGAVLLLTREGYRGGDEGYYSGLGYVLAIPIAAYLAGAVARGPSGAGRRRLAAAGAIALMVGTFGVERFTALRRGWEGVVAFDTPRGRVYCAPGEALFLERASRFISARTKVGETILMLPTTAGLDFLFDRPNASFFSGMFPDVIAGLDGEWELIERWRRRPPRVIVEVRHGLGVFRRGEFGQRWGRQAMSWIEEHYRPVVPEASERLEDVRYWELAGVP